ncbi:MAG: GIY-YIG nuclease family protein [Pseudotabrizicola sp.]|uniref:GIY-YIG nuclease family protein n=1 Tax=Pseudotabrizicola sp. TaxID=2939647 RepID=UPI0027317E7E|nr:GIY-YIG nuclease family protein [Pseudotabrizicola sp.]MDP2080658.1 GIY-YIG nuclease family protein [Pseudotabrizicola sp.]MDZ7573387.1 GIY-YIG nuclease family protein [Pseudotabrizicola sp.]
MRKLRYVVYKITFPNGKIYVGKDIGEPGHALRYFGSWHNESVEADFTVEDLRDFTLRKTILFESDDKLLVTQKESEFIRTLRSNDPDTGYNRSHRPRRVSQP